MVFISPTRDPGNQPRFIDVNTNFGRYDRPLLVNDYDAIANQIYNILSTTIGERIFEPEFGSNLDEFLFSPTDVTTAWLIENEIYRALGRWMPRIEIVRNQTRAIPFPSERYFDVSIYYRIIGIESTDIISFRFFQAGAAVRA